MNVNRRIFALDKKGIVFKVREIFLLSAKSYRHFILYGYIKQIGDLKEKCVFLFCSNIVWTVYIRDMALCVTASVQQNGVNFTDCFYCMSPKFYYSRSCEYKFLTVVSGYIMLNVNIKYTCNYYFIFLFFIYFY